MIVDFKQVPGKFIALKSSVAISNPTKFRYFECDVVINKDDVPIYIGIVDSK